MFVGNGIVCRQNQQLAKVSGWGKGWMIAFKIKILGTPNYRGNVIQLTNGRLTAVPGLWTVPGSRKLLILNSGIRFTTSLLPSHGFVNIKIQQIPKAPGQYVYSIFINGKKVFKTLNGNARAYPRLTLYAGNPWERSAKCIIRNLRYGIVTVKPQPKPRGTKNPFMF